LDKAVEEKKLKAQMLQQESQVKALQTELDDLTEQLKEKEQNFRSNEVKIKEMRRQLPKKLLKPLDQKYHKILTQQ